MGLIEKYGIKNGQTYMAADGTNHGYKVIDSATYADVDDVVVADLKTGAQRRIDAFKLAMVRYSLMEDESTITVSGPTL